MEQRTTFIPLAGMDSRSLKLRLGLVFLLWGWYAYSLDPNKLISQYIHESWGYKEGLPQVSVLALIQSREGYLWIGTQEGLVRFDGVTMEVFEEIQTPGLGSNHIYELFEDSKGRLWIGSKKGVFSYKEGVFRSYEEVPQAPQVNIYSIRESADGTIWVGTVDGLYRYDGSHFTPVTLANQNPLPTVRCIFEDADHKMWFGTVQGLWHWQANSPFPVKITMDEPSLDRVFDLFQDPSGALWIGASNGLYVRREGRIHKFSAAEGFRAKSAMAFAQDREQTIWIGTDAGLYRFRDGKFSTSSGDDRLHAYEIHSILIDREENLWVGTLVNGLHRYRDGLFSCFGQPEGLPNDIVRALLQDREKRIWVGTEGGVARIDNGTIKVFDESNGLSNQRIQCLGEDHLGRVWAGTRYGGLNCIDGDQVVAYTTAQGLPSNDIRAVFEDSEKNFWVSVLDVGLVLFEKGSFRKMNSQMGVDSTRIYSFFEDRQKRLWLGLDGDGLVVIGPAGNQRFTPNDGLAGPTVFGFHQDSRGDIWIATNGGLSRFRDGRLVSIQPLHGLYNGVIYCLIEDDRNHFWMTCNKGIFSVSRHELNQFANGHVDRITSLAYGVSDGMRSPECNFGGNSSGLIVNSGEFWFPTISGIVQFTPAVRRLNRAEPPVVIEAVVADSQTFSPRGPAIFGPDLKNLEIRYSALSFSEPEKVEFRYRLEGFDKEWQSVQRRHAFYTNLPARDYRFQVIASNNDGFWNHTGASFQFKVIPRFYQTLWFYTAMGVALLFLTYAIYMLRIRTLVKRERRLQTQIGERTRALVAANQELERTQEQLVRAAHQAGMAEIATNILHNIGNALNSVNVTMSLLSRDVNGLKVDFFKRVVGLVNERSEFLQTKPPGDSVTPKILLALNQLADSLYRVKDRIHLDLATLEDQILNLNNIIRVQQAHAGFEGFYETVDLYQLIETIAAGQKPVLEEHDIELECLLEPMPRIRIQKSKMVQVLIQVIKNAVEAIEMGESRAKNRITIKAWQGAGDVVLVEISDTGVGIDPSIADRVFYHGFSTKPHRGGYGLHYCANAVMEMKGTISVRSDGNGRGTVFTLEIPMDPT